MESTLKLTESSSQAQVHSLKIYWESLNTLILWSTWGEWDLKFWMLFSTFSTLGRWKFFKKVCQALTKFSISRKSREEMVHFFLSRAEELNFHFSRCSRMSWFWRKNSRSPLEIRDFEKNSLSLLERMRFCKQILFSRVKILREKNHFFLSIIPSILVRNHISIFGWILTSSVFQKEKVF